MFMMKRTPGVIISEEVARSLVQRMARCGLSVKQVAARATLPRETVSRMLNSKGRKFDSGNVKAIADALGTSMLALFGAEVVGDFPDVDALLSPGYVLSIAPDSEVIEAFRNGVKDLLVVIAFLHNRSSQEAKRRMIRDPLGAGWIVLREKAVTGELPSFVASALTKLFDDGEHIPEYVRMTRWYTHVHKRVRGGFVTEEEERAAASALEDPK